MCVAKQIKPSTMESQEGVLPNPSTLLEELGAHISQFRGRGRSLEGRSQESLILKILERPLAGLEASCNTARQMEGSDRTEEVENKAAGRASSKSNSENFHCWLTAPQRADSINLKRF